MQLVPLLHLGEYAKLEWSSVFIARSPRGGSRLTRPLDAIKPSPNTPPLQPLSTGEKQLSASAVELGEAVKNRLESSGAGLRYAKRGGVRCTGLGFRVS
jgi:hypothetical protein